MKTKILIVEDDEHIATGLQAVLESEGYEATVCGRGNEALVLIGSQKPSLVLLDVMLPGKSGYDVCKELRAAGDRTLVLMLTAKGQELDKVVGLDLGADDYLTKPFGVRELLARIHALLRRSLPGTVRSDNFQVGAATIDRAKLELRQGVTVHNLSQKELKLLELFAAHPGEVLSRDRLLSEVWGYNYYGTTRTLDQVIVQLRKKLGEPACIQTVHGVGYKHALV